MNDPPRERRLHSRRAELRFAWLEARRSLATIYKRGALKVYEWIWP